MVPKSTLVILTIITFFAIFQHGLAQSDATRLSNLNKLLHSGSRSFISLQVDQFRKLVESAPRSYSLITLFSADKQYCPHCDSVRNQLDRVANEYYNNPIQQSKSTHVFFVDVHVQSSDQDFLMHYNIQKVPLLYHFSHGTKRAFPKQISDHDPDKYPFEKGIAANIIKKFVNDRCRSHMIVRRGGYKIMFKSVMKTVIPILFVIASFGGVFAVYNGSYKNPMLWFTLVMLVYIYSVGGGHYSWIHDTPFLVVDNDGRSQYFARGSRSQFGAEGFMVSVTCVTISVLIISIQRLPKVVPEKSAQNLVGFVMVSMTFFAISFLLKLYERVSTNFLSVTTRKANIPRQ